MRLYNWVKSNKKSNNKNAKASHRDDVWPLPFRGVRREREWGCENPGEENLRSGSTINKQAARKGQHPKTTKVRAVDQAINSIRRRLKRAFPIWVHSNSSWNLDIKHQRSIHRKLQRSIGKVLALLGKQQYHPWIQAEKYWHGSWLWS